MPKIMTIVGTRPEIIKMSRVIAEFDAYTDHLLVHTGQNYDYELNEVFFEDLSIRPLADTIPNVDITVPNIEAEKYNVIRIALALIRGEVIIIFFFLF